METPQKKKKEQGQIQAIWDQQAQVWVPPRSGQVAETCRNSQVEIQEIEHILGSLCVFRGAVAGKGQVGSLKLV